MCHLGPRVFLLTLWIGLFLTLAAGAADQDGAKPKKGRQRPTASESADRTKPARPAAAERYVVVDLDGEIVVRKRSELAKLRKEQSDSYRAKLKEYHAAKKAAKETGEKIDAQMPAKQKIKQFGMSFKTEEEAKAHRDKILAAQKDKPRGKSTRRKSAAADRS